MLVAVGWLAIYSAEYSEASGGTFALSMSHGKQLLNIAIGLVLGLFLLLFDHRLYHTFAPIIYGVTMTLLLLTLFIGHEVAGAKGWINLGFFQLQTAELAKFSTALFLAHHIGTYEFSMSRMRDRLICFGIIALPIIFIMLQNDTGSAMVFLSLFFVLYRFGLPSIFLILPLWLMVVCLAVLLVQPIPVLVVIGLLTLLFLLFARSNRKLTLVGLGASAITTGGYFFGRLHL